MLLEAMIHVIVIMHLAGLKSLICTYAACRRRVHYETKSIIASPDTTLKLTVCYNCFSVDCVTNRILASFSGLVPFLKQLVTDV